MSKHHARLNAKTWALTRLQAFERDGWRCTNCGAAGRLEAHHEPPLRAGADPYDLAGIRTLCRNCHLQHHQGESETPGRAEWRDFVAEML
ncbi:MAG: HNH endonuclease [Boseongicola sp. SB0677_bin_26]|nr:HNH endonuclease [Boseongicola sp. SB0677_bin_26]